MDLGQAIAQAKDVFSQLSNPVKAGAAGGAAAGALGAYTQEFRDKVLANVQKFGIQLGPIWDSGVLQALTAGASNAAPAPSSSAKTIFGFTYLQAGLIAGAAVLAAAAGAMLWRRK